MSEQIKGEIQNILEERIKLLDLLHGRKFRLHAEQYLQQAIDFEEHQKRYRRFGPAGLPIADIFTSTIEENLDCAVHLESIAIKAEQGIILWGGRYNRCGYQPKVEVRHAMFDAKEMADGRYNIKKAPES